MNCCCKKGRTKDLIIEGDVGADPFWCKKCKCNIDSNEVPISVDLKQELLSWSTTYGEWIDWKVDAFIPNGIELENEFNHKGIALTKKVQQEIGNTYSIQFIASTSARMYMESNLDK